MLAIEAWVTSQIVRDNATVVKKDAGSPPLVRGREEHTLDEATVVQSLHVVQEVLAFGSGTEIQQAICCVRSPDAGTRTRDTEADGEAKDCLLREKRTEAVERKERRPRGSTGNPVMQKHVSSPSDAVTNGSD